MSQENPFMKSGTLFVREVLRAGAVENRTYRFHRNYPSPEGDFSFDFENSFFGGTIYALASSIHGYVGSRNRGIYPSMEMLSSSHMRVYGFKEGMAIVRDRPFKESELDELCNEFFLLQKLSGPSEKK